MPNGKILTILVLLGCIVFSGCGSKKTEGNDNTSESQETYARDNSADIGSRLLISASNDTLHGSDTKRLARRDNEEVRLRKETTQREDASKEAVSFLLPKIYQRPTTRISPQSQLP